jgi:hypothetical protein
MSRYYEARRFRRTDPNVSVREGVGAHKYDAADDAEAVWLAKELHLDFYDPATDQIEIWEIHFGEEDRLVAFVEGTDA